ncbi:hypothetical protein TNCV_1694731 [Trichonephila clavipes]|nr:hypothetical protein TNCV_1694731 [Trichonephila clavipes]
MIVQFRNEKVSNHGSIPITIDCNVVAFIVFEEGFHQPIKRTKQSVFLDTLSDRGPQNSSLQKTKCTPTVSRSFDNHAGNTIWLVSILILKEKTKNWPGASHLSSPSTKLTRGLEARWLFRVPPCHEVTVHLQTSMPSPGLEPRSYGIAVRIPNHYRMGGIFTVKC